MSINTLSGTPFVGYASLTNGAPGPINFAIYQAMGVAAYTLATNERVYVTNITLASNDATQALVTVDTGGTVPTKLASSYLSSVQPPIAEQIPPGCCRGIFGVAPRAMATSVSAGKTVELVIKGYISRM